jgi:hypothetical protein
MPRVFAMYRLKRGVSAEAFVQWSKTVDQVVMKRQPPVHRFDVYRITESIRGESPYDFVEEIEISDWPSWLAMIENDEVRGLAAAFEQLADAPNMVMVGGERF